MVNQLKTDTFYKDSIVYKDKIVTVPEWIKGKDGKDSLIYVNVKGKDSIIYRTQIVLKTIEDSSRIVLLKKQIGAKDEQINRQKTILKWFRTTTFILLLILILIIVIKIIK